MKVNGFLAASLVLLLAFAGIASAINIYEQSCSDGTKYFQCSQGTPGYACLPDSTSGNGVSLQNDVESKIVKTTDGTSQPKCACANFPGYMEKDGKCVKTTCTDTNGKTLESGACSVTKPNRCIDGNLVENSLACGCPEGKQVASDSKTCVRAVGCRWGNPPCQPNQECKYVESAKDEGHCVAKQGCAYNTVTCTSMQYCDTSGDSNGVCTTREGCQYLNPPCHAGETCNSATGVCEAGESADEIGSASTAGAAVSDDFVATCCCAPVLAMAGLAGIVIVKKRE
ncbi:hypothetical protein COU37_00705 [Candidatus Micrarchaeota archaeon CG10_big_fil_rev_8_21_14_0_10_45_29]|nr:MAG: hypothetical protein COU37_00705 [Candidatus Micrarchaeota archaeon CG10_big_fil_rev_8_21_14_0_10_45_29]